MGLKDSAKTGSGFLPWMLGDAMLRTTKKDFCAIYALSPFLEKTKNPLKDTPRQGDTFSDRDGQESTRTFKKYGKYRQKSTHTAVNRQTPFLLLSGRSGVQVTSGTLKWGCEKMG